MRYRWTEEAFLRAAEAGVFGDQQVELVEGEVWRVVHGTWHGAVTAAVTRALPDLDGRYRVTSASLPSAGSVPDPDVWVHRRDAEPVEQLSARVARWDPQDVALVVEVSDETVGAGLGGKADLYARAGYMEYWVVTRRGVHVHAGPGSDRYREVRLLGPTEQVAVPYASDVALDVASLVSP